MLGSDIGVILDHNPLDVFLPGGEVEAYKMTPHLNKCGLTDTRSALHSILYMQSQHTAITPHTYVLKNNRIGFINDLLIKLIIHHFTAQKLIGLCNES